MVEMHYDNPNMEEGEPNYIKLHLCILTDDDVNLILVILLKL